MMIALRPWDRIPNSGWAGGSGAGSIGADTGGMGFTGRAGTPGPGAGPTGPGMA
jgi:hypothetical protein